VISCLGLSLRALVGVTFPIRVHYRLAIGYRLCAKRLGSSFGFFFLSAVKLVSPLFELDQIEVGFHARFGAAPDFL
jgi:hypothetical protein